MDFQTVIASSIIKIHLLNKCTIFVIFSFLGNSSFNAIYLCIWLGRPTIFDWSATDKYGVSNYRLHKVLIGAPLMSMAYKITSYIKFVYNELTWWCCKDNKCIVAYALCLLHIYWPFNLKLKIKHMSRDPSEDCIVEI